MLEYVDKMLIPYANGKRNEHQSPGQAELLISDVFSAHRVQAFKDKLESNNIKLLYAPAGCTGSLVTCAVLA